MSDIASMKTADGRFAYEAAGTTDSPALIFLHGIGGAGRAFHHQLQNFGSRYRTLAWDMPGYGGSSRLDAVSIPALARALKDFLQACGAKRPILVGHSIGGMIVQQALADDPNIADRVVLAQTSPAFGKSDGEWQKNFIDARLGPLDRGETMASMASGLVRELVGDNPDPDGIALACDCMASVPEDTFRNTMKAMLGFDLRNALGKIAVPTLVLSGSKDTNAPAPMMAKMTSYIPGATYVELDGVGHLAGLEQPDRFNAAIDDFLKNQSQKDASS